MRYWVYIYLLKNKIQKEKKKRRQCYLKSDKNTNKKRIAKNEFYNNIVLLTVELSFFTQAPGFVENLI